MARLRISSVIFWRNREKADVCEYLSQDVEQELHQAYGYIIGKLVNMINHPAPWVLRGK